MPAILGPARYSAPAAENDDDIVHMRRVVVGPDGWPVLLPPGVHLDQTSSEPAMRVVEVDHERGVVTVEPV